MERTNKMSMAFAALARRREQERVLLERQSFLKENARADCAAKWEKRSFDKIEQQDILTRVKKLADHDDKETEDKRNQIRILYASEMIEWKAMVSSLQSKLNEEREYQLRDKALKLKEKREQERLEIAKACYERQWLESSEQARSLVAQSRNDRLMNDRKEALYLNASKDSQDFLRGEGDEVNQYIRIQEERENQERLSRQLKNSEIRSALDDQMNDLKIKGDSENKKKWEEERALLTKWRLDDEQTNSHQRDALKLARDRGTEILRANVDRLRKVNDREDLEDERDKLLLQYAMEKEKRELEDEKNRKLNQEGACKGFILTLQDQKTKDQEDLESIEKCRMEAMEEIHQKRDRELKSQYDDRKQRMLEINKTRQEQMNEKERHVKEEKAAFTKQNMETLTQLERQSQYEAEQRRKKQEMTIQTMLCNKELAQMKADRRLKEKKEKYMNQVDLDKEESKQKVKLDQLANQLVSKSTR